MSGWFQRTPDPPRKKQLQREHSLEKQKAGSRLHPQVSPTLSAKGSPSSEGSRTPTGGSATGKHAPLSATKSSPISNSSSSPTTSPERQLDSSGKMEKSGPSSAKLEELQKEIQRLKENECSLSKKLALEREHRVRAEQLVEVERLAFHKVQFRLYLEERNHRYNNDKKVQEDEAMNSEEVDSPDTNFSESPIDLRECEGPEKSSYSIESFSPISAEFNFSTSIFGQLTNDLQKILRVGQTEDAQAKSVFSCALDAVKSGNSSDLQDCVPLLRKEDGLPLLKLAAEKGHSSCLRTLLCTAMFDPSVSNASGVTPLHAAAMHGQKKAAEVLLEYRACLDATDTEGYTPLFLALRERHGEMAGMLIKAGAHLDVISNSGHTLLHAAVMGHLPGALHSILVRLRVHSDGGSKVRDLITHKDDDYRTALHIAAARGLKSCTEVLCATGEVDVTQRDRWNCTPIEVATGDTKDILINKDSKSIILYVQTSSSSISPTIAHNTSYDLPETDEQEEGKEEEMFSLAIGNLNVLRHHTFSDLGHMVNSSLHNFCSYINLRGTHSSGSANDYSSSTRYNWEDKINLGLIEIASRKYQIARYFLPSGSEVEAREDSANSDSGFKEDMQDGRSKRMAHIKECKSVLGKFASKLSGMEFTDHSIHSYSIGKYSWKAGMLPKSLRSKNLFNLLSEMSSSGSGKPPGVHIKLRGADENELDQLSLEVMMPMSQLKDSIQILKHERKLLIHGPHGNGKAHLARKLARYLQAVHGEKQTQVINVYVDEDFERDDLFRLFHSNNLLLPAMSEGITTAKKASSSSFKRHVLILNHLSSATHPGLMAHIISLLESREAQLSLWVNEVPNSHEEGIGKPDVPGGLYYMKEDCYIIGTWTSAAGDGTNLPPAIVDHFPHVSMGIASALCCGVLRRQLLSASIHCANGVWPHSTQPLYRLMQWVGDIWILYNKLLADLGLAYAPTALKHFLSCPVSSLTPEKDIPQWLITTWRYHIVPSVQCVLQDYFNQDSTSTLVYQVLSSIVGLAVLPTCPLSHDRRDEVVQAICHNIEEYCSATSRPIAMGSGLVGETPANSSPLFHSYHSSPPSMKKLSPLLGQRRGSLQSLNSPTFGRKGILQRGSPLVDQRRGSWTDLRSAPHVTFEKPGKLVSYEDMVKNSPRLKEKFKKIKEETHSAPVTPTTTISISPPEDYPKGDGLSSPEIPNFGEKEGPERDIKSPTKERVGNKLKKIRSKTISLFSRDGTGTLPRLFRRGSRAPLTSVTEEEPKSPFHAATMRHTSLPTPSYPIPKFNSKPEFTRSLDDSNLPSSGSTYKSRRTPPPPPPLPIQNGNNTDVMKETRDTTEALQDLDNFLDLLTATPTDRIDKQRGSLPSNLQSCGDDTGSDDGEERSLTVPKYYLPTTSSPWQQKYQKRLSSTGQMGGASPPAFSMPNLSIDSPSDDHEMPLKSFPKQSPSSYLTSQQFLTSKQPSPDESTGHNVLYIQRSRSPRIEEEAEEEQYQQDQVQYCESSGSDVPSKHHHHSFHADCAYNPHHYQHQHQHSLPHNRGKSPVGPRQQQQEAAMDQADGANAWWDTNGGASSQEDGFLSPTKRIVDVDGRSPSPLAMTSYSSNETRSPSSKYFTYHVGFHKRRALLHDNFQLSGGGCGQEKARVPSPHFGERRLDQGDLYNGEDVDNNCNSPIGRLDVWSNRRRSEDESWNSMERSKSLSYGKPQCYQTDRGVTQNTVIPPPLDILKKRASVSNAHYDDRSNSSRESLKRRSGSTGSMQDLKADSISDPSSPKALDSGTLFGASLGFLGSSGSLNDIHSNM